MFYPLLKIRWNIYKMEDKVDQVRLPPKIPDFQDKEILAIYSAVFPSQDLLLNRPITNPSGY
jgi:hypothetical protein